MTGLLDSPYAWRRLLASVTMSTMGGIGMWALAVAMPAVQGDLGVSRADISLGYSTNMIGLLSRIAVLSNPFASRGVAGVQIFNPGMFA